MLHNVKGALALMLAVTNVLVMAVPFFSTVLLKVLLPGAAVKRGLTGLITALAWQYNRNNAWIFQGMSHISGVSTGSSRCAKTGVTWSLRIINRGRISRYCSAYLRNTFRC